MLERFFGKKETHCALVRHWPWTLVGILAIAAVLRLINIGTEPYWADEVLSLDIATKSAGIAEIWRYISQVEFHPPLYYFILRFWTVLFGATEAATRSLSLVFGLGTVGLAFLAGKRMFRSVSAGLWAAAVLAVLPIQVEFGQEARPYAMMCFFGVAATLCMWEFLTSRRPILVVGYVVASLIGAYLHYSFAFIPFALAGWWLLHLDRDDRGFRSRDFISWLLAHAAMFIGYFPWLTHVLYKLCLGSLEIYGLTRYANTLRTPYLSESLIHQLVWVTKEPKAEQVEILAIFLAYVLLAWALVSFVRGLDTKRDAERVSTVKFLLWVMCATLALFLASRHSVAYSTLYIRHALFATVPLALLLGYVAVSIPRKQAAVVMSVFFITLVPSLSRVAGNDELWDYDFRLEEACETINEHYREGDLVITVVASYRSDMQHYLRPEIPIASISPVSFFGRDIWSESFRLGLVENEIQVRMRRETKEEVQEKITRLVEGGGYRRVWLFPFSRKDADVHGWFQDRKWRWVYRNLNDILQLDMYSKE